MSVKDIEQAITQLAPSELEELTRWFEEFQAQMWDRQIAQDAKSGKLNHLVEQAKAEYQAGRCKPL